MIDVDEIGVYDVDQYWERVHLAQDKRLVLDPHEFYILASKESVSVPPAYVAEMAPFDPLIGEYRVHYAGFFDPGFGYAEGKVPGAKAVLEVRSLDIPFILEDGQIVGRLVYDRLTEIPDQLYGERIGSHYQAQGLKLSKHFKQDLGPEQLPPPSTQNLAQCGWQSLTAPWSNMPPSARAASPKVAPISKAGS